MLRILKCWSPYAQLRSYAKSKKAPSQEFEAMKYLNVAEKNDAAKTISGLLSSGTARRREGYSVYNKIYDFDIPFKGRPSKMSMTSVSGHLLHLEFLTAYRNWRNIDPSVLFDAPVRKACSDDFAPIKRTLEREIRGCAGLIIWTDCDREGENIGFEIIEVCRAIKPNIPVYRAVFSEITAAAVKRALAGLQTPNQLQSDAVDVRTELDLRTGAAITRFQTMRLQRLFPDTIADKLISYGSCQIPTLGFVAERYKEIEAFVSEPFWKIKVTHTIDELTVEFTWARNRLFDQQACEDLFVLCLADPKATVESVTVKPKSKWRPKALDTVEMEKLGSRKLKLSAKETMSIAEKLYTKGIISYPRTETNQFSNEIDLKSLVEQQTGHGVWGSFAQRVVEWGPNPRNGDKSDQAHPPIHPTKLVTNLEGNEARVYELICRHFLACVSKDATGSETVVHINIAGEKFTATGLVIYERNYLDVYVYEKWNAKQIHNYEQNQVFDPTEITMPEGATTAPPLLTEADLIALMDKHGIGTDATHAEHINTIKERGYIGVVENGCLVPGVIGMGLYEGYDAMELTLAKPNLRAEFEADLKRICLGEKNAQVVLREQIQKYKEAYRQITEKITAMDAKLSQRLNETPTARPAAAGGGDNDAENNTNRPQQLFQCPKCASAPLALKPKKNQSGHFIGCMNYPDCKNVIWLPDDDCKEPSVLDETCERCGADVKLLKFKFQSAYHKGIFSTPFGWYKCCLRCDAQLRDVFNINLECVKRVGGIVGDSGSSNTRTTSAVRATTTFAAGGWGSSAGSTGSAGGARSTAPNDRNKKPNTKQPRSNAAAAQAAPKTAAPAKKTSTTTKKTKTVTNTTNTSSSTTGSSGSIRSYFTSGANARPTETIENAMQEFNDLQSDAFFDSNSFDEAMLLEAEANATATLSNTNSSVGVMRAASGNDANSFTSNTRNTYQQPASNDDSFSAFFRDDDEFENYSWGTASASTSMRAAAPTASSNNNRNANVTPAPKRPRLQTARNQEAEEDVPSSGWGTGATPATHEVRCNVCHQPAKQLTVKKEGPNKGRLFFVCAKSDPCKFFQFLDEIAAPPPSSNTNATSSRAASSHSQASTSSSGAGGWGSSSNAVDNADVVKCGCGVAASSFIVRKEGPNKGRPFYSCPNRDKSCNFFKFADVDDSEQASTSRGARNQSSSWGSSSGRSENFRPANNQGASNDQRAGGKRKCGLCRKEGHTKAKCPRKAEFEI